ESPILTVRGQGYRFVGDVRVVSAEKKAAPAPVVEQAAIEAAPIEESQRGFWQKHWKMIAAAAIVVAVLVAGGLWYHAGKSFVERRSVAILPFQDLSGSPEDTWISTALREMLYSDLTVGGTLKVLQDRSVERMQNELKLEPAASLSSEGLRRVGSNLH